MSQRVLLVDDSPQMHRLVTAWLKCDNVEVVSAHTGNEGAAMAACTPVDAILLDVDMPDVSGFDLCRRLKSDPRCASVPIIFLTGAASPEDRVRGLNLGATDYVIKPFHPAEFQARVRAALRTKHLLDLLQDRAQIDGLTALRNRAYLDQRLASELAQLARRPGMLGGVMVDVDNFKSVNDTLGHTAGDEVLRGVGAVLLERTRVEDVVARYGGEEFAILTPGVGSDGTMLLAERLRQEIESLETRTVAGPVRVTCSFGVAQFDPTAPGSLLRHADAALYAAKRCGKNRVLAYEPHMQQRAA